MCAFSKFSWCCHPKISSRVYSTTSNCDSPRYRAKCEIRNAKWTSFQAVHDSDSATLVCSNSISASLTRSTAARVLLLFPMDGKSSAL